MNYLRQLTSAKISRHIMSRQFCDEYYNQKTIADQLRVSHKKSTEITNVKAQEKITMLPVRHFQKIPANTSMLMYCDLLNHWTGLPREKVQETLGLVNDMFSSLNMLDDVVDGSLTRKTLPAAHVVYGMPHTVMSGVFGILNVIDRMFELLPKESAALCAKNIAGFMRGSAVEVKWRETFYCPEECEYLGATFLKWSNAFEVMTSMLQLQSDCKLDFDMLSKMMGIFYGITNDYSDFNPSPYSEGKKFCDDMTEGKFTFPTVHAVRVKNNNEVYEMICERRNDMASKLRLVDLLESTGSLEYTRNYLKNLHKEIIDEIEKLGGNPKMKNVMDKSVEEGLGLKKTN